MTSQAFKAFIFDLDGTLVDSAAIVERVMRQWCLENGIAYEDVQKSSRSSRTEDTVREIAPHLDAKREGEKVEEAERAALSGLVEVRGAADLLSRLPDERWAVATSSEYATAQAKLTAAGLPVPDVLIGADQVQHGKPHPEAYFSAASGLGFAPADCPVFEDSDTGVKSALSAGCGDILWRSSQWWP